MSHLQLCIWGCGNPCFRLVELRNITLDQICGMCEENARVQELVIIECVHQ